MGPHDGEKEEKFKKLKRRVRNEKERKSRRLPAIVWGVQAWLLPSVTCKNLDVNHAMQQHYNMRKCLQNGMIWRHLSLLENRTLFETDFSNAFDE